MITIHKYLIEITSKQKLEIPSGGKIIKVGLDGHNGPSIWAIVETELVEMERIILLFGTGHELPEDIRINCNYIGTFVEQPYVWHVFERLN